MISKKDVVLWFKELESYKRIDTMCTLLNMCLPFELRFLGTCLEELGRRDSQELRGIELRVNNPSDLASDMIACQKGEPTDKKIRRKMALYLALIRACNRNCVTEIYRTLDGWGDRDFHSINDCDTLQELLLVYTMAANHPVFSFEQHMKFNEIFEKIKDNKLVADPPTPPIASGGVVLPPPPPTPLSQHPTFEHGAAPQHLQPPPHPHLPPATHQELIQTPHGAAIHSMHLPGQPSQLLTAPIQVLPQGSIPINFPQTHLTKFIQAAEGSMQHPLTVDGIQHMISSSISIPADSNTIFTHPGAAWALRQYPAPPPPPQGPPQGQPPTVDQQPPPSSSPMLSQQSTPSSSRATSPNRGNSNTSSTMMQTQPQSLQQQQGRGMQPQRIGGGGGSLKNIRRPSAETTPPPVMVQMPAPQQQQVITNEFILPQNVKHIDDMVANSEGGGNQLQTLIRNGYTRGSHHPRHKGGSYMPPHQQPSPVGGQPFQSNFTGLAYMSMVDTSSGSTHGAGEGSGLMSMNSNKSAGSDSGSSVGSSGDITPPETPTLVANTGNLRLNSEHQQQTQTQSQSQRLHQPHMGFKQMSLSQRLNGRPEKTLHPVSGSNVSTCSTIIYANPHPPLVQQQSPMYSSEIILTQGGNAGTANMGQTSSANCSVATSTMSTNVNTGLNSPSPVGGIIGNTSTVVLQPPHQPQYNASYPYHAAHLAASAARPPLIAHNPAMAPLPGTFRLPGFQLQPNSEILYPAYHPSGGITYLSGTAPPGAPTVTLRSGTSTVQASTAAGVVPQSLQLNQVTVGNAPLLSNQQPYTTVIGPPATNKPVSCYNCGSQAHTGRECAEISMDDVTRGAIYKLDYSVSTAPNTNPSPTVTNTLSGSSNEQGASHQHSTLASVVASNSASAATASMKHEVNPSLTVSTASTSTSTHPPAATSVINTK